MRVADTIEINSIVVKNRMRSDLGDIDQLSKSISDNGLIQPIVLTKNEGDLDQIPVMIPCLVAGERRLRALQKLGITHLNEGEHFIWREDLDEYRQNAIELEENIRRKAMTWSEEVLGKQRLLEIYQRIHGVPVLGQPTRSIQQGLKPAGFSIKKLSEILNESQATTSQDLEMAALVSRLPILAKEPTREAAKARLVLALKIQAGQAATHVAKPLIYKILVECESEAHQIALLQQFRTAGLKCQVIVA